MSRFRNSSQVPGSVSTRRHSPAAFSISLLVSFLLLPAISGSQVLPKREMRASWLTTVWGLDWPGVKIPSGGSSSTIQLQKRQLTRILDSMQVVGMNAIFFQVRTECDAFYPSSFEPWSAHLCASRGVEPGWDPLAFAVEESHKRGMELHAWLNPYRFESVAGKYAGQPGDYRQTHPEWVLTYTGGGSILDPGNPEVRELIAGIVREIITLYDVDGIVFDDYFYAYDGTPAALDQYSQTRWRPQGMDLGDWRRDNVNRMIADVYNTIGEVKPWVTFGVSPFGIWSVDAVVAATRGVVLPRGITGMDAYKSIYCDPLAWLEEGTVDYISPQIYWPTTSTGQNYNTLSEWWSEIAHRFGRHLYVSHSLSDLDPSDYPPPVALKSAGKINLSQEMKGLSMMEYFSMLTSTWGIAGLDPSEYGLQVSRNRSADKTGAPGSVFFRSTLFFTKGVINYFRSHEYRWPALPPVKNWNSFSLLPLVTAIHLEGTTLEWESAGNEYRYGVYAIPEESADDSGVFSTGRYLLGMTYDPHFSLSARPGLLSGHRFAVSVIDRNGNESAPVIMGGIPGDNKAVDLLIPEEGQQVYVSAAFGWSAVPGADGYILEVAADPSYRRVVCRREVSGESFPLQLSGVIEDSVYYWRVYTRMAGVQDVVTSGRSFKVIPRPRPVILSPGNEATAVEVTPLITWKPMEEYSFRLQIATVNTFSFPVYDKSGLTGNSLRLPAGVLTSFGVYFLRMQAFMGDSSTLWSDVIKFSTVRTPPSVPSILTPESGSVISGTSVIFSTRGDPLAGGYSFQWSSSSAFPWNNVKQQTVNAPDTVLKVSDLSEGVWYVRVRAGYSNGLFTDWSPSSSFSFLYSSLSDKEGNRPGIRVVSPLSGDVVSGYFTLPEPGMVTIRIRDITGREVITSKRGWCLAGEQSFNMNGVHLLPGVYMVVLESSADRRVVKVVKP